MKRSMASGDAKKNIDAILADLRRAGEVAAAS
jgi:hypothetical protein